MQRENLEKTEFDWSRGRFPTWLKMIICIAVVLLLMLVFFRVRHFEVTGNVRYTAEEVADASGLTVGDILMGVNKTSTAGRLLTKLPYLEQVVITRKLPSTVCFDVVECTAAGQVMSEFYTYWLMSSSGKLLEEADDPDELPGQLPEINGVELTLPSAGDTAVFTDTEKGEVAMRVLQAADRTGLLGRITEINVENLDEIYAVYEERIQIQMGDGSDAEYKLRYMLTVLGEIAEDQRGALDLTFSTGEQAIFHPLQ